MAMNGVSIIVPFLNESEGILEFCKAIDEHVKTLDFPVELVFINDGSTDDSEKKVRTYKFHNVSKVQLIVMSKNFGVHAAIRAGIMDASFDICMWMQCDLEDPMEMIKIGHDKIVNEGYNSVCFEKKSIEISKTNRMFSRMYSWLMRKYAVSNYSSGGTATIVFDKKIKDALNKNIEKNSALMLQILDLGFRTCTIPLEYHKRMAGKSRWTLSKKIKLFIDSFVAFSFMPIRLVSIVGIIIFVIGIVIGIEAFVNWIIHPDVVVGYSTLVCILSIGFGITNISLGIIAEYLWRTFDAARNRPVFVVKDKVVIKKDSKVKGNHSVS